MKGKVKIGDKNVDLNFNGATPIWYNQVFKEDLFVTAENYSKSPTNGESVGIYSKVAFIGMNQAKTNDLSGLTFLDYTNWAAKFETFDFATAVDSIAELYSRQAETTAKPKK